MYDDLKEMYRYMHAHIYTYTHMYAATRTAAHAQAYTTLVKNCSSKLNITWHTITYLITEAYLDKLHTVLC